jgi:energy-coupling factor transporter ATP-binding protein EcfA2
MARKKAASKKAGQEASPKVYTTARPTLRDDRPLPPGDIPKPAESPPAEHFKSLNGHPVGPFPGRPAESDRCITAAELVSREHRWFWPGYIPLDQIVLMVGDSGAGKSTVLAAVAANVTQGREMSGRGGLPPGRVLIYGSEEDAGATIRPRLEAYNADLSRVFLGDVGRAGRPLPRLVLPDDIVKLGRRVLDLKVSVLILDPITAYLSGGLDSNKDQQVRQMLDAMSQMAMETGCTILATKHYRKSREGGPLDWIGGAPAWSQIPRVILAFGFDPDDRTKRVMAVSKNSITPGVRSLRYSIEDRNGVGALITHQLCDLSAEDMGAGSLNPADRDALGDAQAFLIDSLSDEERPAKDVVRIAQESGIALGTLRRAKAKLGVTSHPVGPNGQRYIVWRMPVQEPPATPPAGA